MELNQRQFWKKTCYSLSLCGFGEVSGHGQFTVARDFEHLLSGKCSKF